MNFPDSIFKAYDIRGLVASELSEDLASRIGRAFVRLIREEIGSFEGKKLVVGYDMRPTSLPFKQKLIEGITAEGVDVVDIGMASTPLFNFACAHIPEHCGGIMVTASHNPAEYNGFKLTRADGLPVGKGTGMEQIHEWTKQNAFENAATPGTVSKRSVLDDYFEKLFALVSPSDLAPLKVVIDGGNGMGSVTFFPLLEKLPLQVEYLYMEPDGTFPNHEANPLKEETLRDLQKKVQETGADFGFALDGDADRVGLVDEKGEVVGASFVGCLLGLEVLKSHPGMHMLYDLRSSQISKELWEQNGATTEMCMVGHALIKNMMRKGEAGFASELSLHIFYGDFYNLESSDLSFLLIAKMLSEQKKKLSDIVAPLQKYAHSGEINFEVEKKDEAMKKIQEHFQDEALETSSLDGLWMKFSWGWLSVRKSNTEPVLRLNLETSKKEFTEEKVEEIKKIILSV